jgi:YD repeat-containing protein
MKKKANFIIVLLLFCFVFACKRDRIEPDISKPDPGDTTIYRNFKLLFENPHGNWNRQEKLNAQITIVNPKEPEKQVLLTVPVLMENPCSTPVVKLPKGGYQIARLIINDESGSTRFATPVAGSGKASQVGKPLSVTLNLDQKADQEVRLEVLPVSSADRPEHFGYPAGSFSGYPVDPQPPMDKRVFVRAQVKLGAILYDSIPAQLILKSWDAKGEMDYRIHYLGAGSQAIYMPAKAVKFELSISKWGSYAQLTLTQGEVQENALYVIGGQSAGRVLKSVTEARITGTTSTPLTKTDFEYDAQGNVKQRLVWGKRADMTTYLMHKDLFEYINGHITSIYTYDENNNLIKTSKARYNGDRVTYLEEVQGASKSVINAIYLPLEGGSNHAEEFRIDAKFQYGNGKFTDFLSKSMLRGAVFHDVYTTQNAGGEEGSYDYDFNINPYVHLRIPDQHFSQYIKHNITFSRKIYRGGRPQIEPYDYKYTYDTDGYPSQLLTKYRNTETKADYYAIRKVFTYQ